MDNELFNGYDYTNQAWVVNGIYQDCGHPDEMGCACFGRLHADEKYYAPHTHDLSDDNTCRICHLHVTEWREVKNLGK